MNYKALEKLGYKIDHDYLRKTCDVIKDPRGQLITVINTTGKTRPLWNSHKRDKRIDRRSK